MLRQILVLLPLLIMFSCSSKAKTSVDTGNNKSDISLYKEGMKYLKAKDFENAIEVFTELEIIIILKFSSKVNLWLDLHSICRMNMKKPFLLLPNL